MCVTARFQHTLHVRLSVRIPPGAAAPALGRFPIGFKYHIVNSGIPEPIYINQPRC